MGVISVDSASLAWLAAECDRLAESVISMAPAVNGGFGVTSAAVRAFHDEVDGAERRISDRLQTTGESVSHAGTEFAVAEARNEDRLHDV